MCSSDLWKQKVDQDFIDRFFSESSLRKISEANKDFDFEDELENVEIYKELFIELFFSEICGEIGRASCRERV